MENLAKYIEDNFNKTIEMPDFKAGETIAVTYMIREGNKERPQTFQGTVIQRRGQGKTATFTIRKVSSGISVERIFPISSPFLRSVKVLKKGKVRRARLYYLRDRFGKSARIKERVVSKQNNKDKA